MAWQANIIRVDTEERGVAVIVVFDNGTKKITQDFHFTSGTKETVFSTIISKLDSFDSLDKFPTDIPIGPVVRPTPIEPPPPPAVTPKQLYAKEVISLRHLANAVALKVIDASNPLYTNQLALVINGFDPTYADLF